MYGPKILTKTRATFKKIWKRAALLYILCVTFTLIYTAWALHFPESEKYQTIYPHSGPLFILSTYVLKFSFGWTDFLARYAWFMFFAPFALWLIAKKHTWLVIGGSVLIWLVLGSNDLFSPFSGWQIIFIAGILLGYYFPALQSSYRSTPKRLRRMATVSVVSVSLLTIVASSFMYIAAPLLESVYPGTLPSSVMQSINSFATSLNELTGKENPSLLRLAIGSVWFVAIFLLFRKYESAINSFTGGALALLGKNSLFVYCPQAFLLFVIDAYLRPAGGSTNIINGSILAIFLLLAVYLATLYRGFLVKITKHFIKGIITKWPYSNLKQSDY